MLPPPRKSLGQHFLRDSRIVERIVTTANVTPDDLVLEIGPGRGALTERLLDTGAGVLAVEVDRDLVPYLRDRFAGPRFAIVEADITRCDLARELAAANQRDDWHFTRTRVVANLPYNLSSPILTALIENRRLFADFTVMLQREVVERIAAPPGGKDYGYFSVFVQAFCETRKCFDVSPQSFQPPPKVWSSVAKLIPRAAPLVAPEDEADFKAVASAAFGQRRKMLGTALKGICPAEAVLREAGIDPKRRAETVSVEEFVRLGTLRRRLKTT